ncbi:hypothetical protein ACRPHS_11050 [Pantoea allii]|uniref:hypothetical protein n=1 Tax=Pantoea allii TaxID=574096 RepID=UPI00155FB336|nr:hypothetical protein [Pantoea allii]NQS84996.1 hypothetical protein [Pantoea allii]
MKTLIFLIAIGSPPAGYGNDFINMKPYSRTFSNSADVDAFANQSSISLAMNNNSDGIVNKGISNSPGASIGTFMDNQ